MTGRSLQYLLLLLLFLIVQNGVGGLSNDGFIVDDEPRPKEEGKSAIKKSNLDRNPKPVLKSMAMSLTPSTHHHTDTSKGKDSVKKSTSGHIEPPINLEKSLQNLDLASKRGLHTYVQKQHISSETVSTTTAFKQDHPKLTKTNNYVSKIRSQNTSATNELDSQKKSASPNVLTNSTITGFLSRNRSYTIDSVGKPQDAEKKNEDKKTAESRKLDKIYSNLNATGAEESDGKNARSMINSVHEKDNHIKIGREDSEIKADTLIDAKRSKGDSKKLSIVDASDFEIRRFNHDDEKRREKEERKSSTPQVKNEKLHIASEDDFVKLAYIKKKEMEDENAMKKAEVASHPEDECNEEKKCPKNKYCRNFHCFEAHRKHHECDEDDECADERLCVYGRCDDKPKGSPGSICEKDGDCGDGCCVIEPTIDERHGICKKKLLEFHQCSPILFRKVWIGEKPDCGPCADGLECKERGMVSSHLVCMKKK